MQQRPEGDSCNSTLNKQRSSAEEVSGCVLWQCMIAVPLQAKETQQLSKILLSSFTQAQITECFFSSQDHAVFIFAGFCSSLCDWRKKVHSFVEFSLKPQKGRVYIHNEILYVCLSVIPSSLQGGECITDLLRTLKHNKGNIKVKHWEESSLKTFRIKNVESSFDVTPHSLLSILLFRKQMIFVPLRLCAREKWETAPIVSSFFPSKFISNKKIGIFCHMFF